MPDTMPDFLQEAESYFDYTQALRRDFHRHPELGFQEIRTAGIVARELSQLGIEVSSGVGKTGVIGILEGDHPGPTVLVRFDMDALPIEEETQAEYASLNSGVMHACGHDGHTAIGLTVARMLNNRRAELAGSVKLVFQPAEEGLGGARAMLVDGVLGNPRPDLTLALHLWNEKPYGWLDVTPGPAMAASETFSVKLIGSGGHGASPHLTIDPVLAAAHVTTTLQSIVARNVSPLDTAVISVTSIQAGEAFNVIPSTALLKGTIRTYLPHVRQLVLERFRDVVTGVAQALGCQAEIDLQEVTPAVINDPQVSARVQEVARRLFPEAELSTTERTMGSEDMAYMMQDIPGCYFFIGSNNSARGLNAPHHHPKFDFDERALPRAAALMAAAACEFLQE
jgi:amidohydrolase